LCGRKRRSIQDAGGTDVKITINAVTVLTLHDMTVAGLWASDFPARLIADRLALGALPGAAHRLFSIQGRREIVGQCWRPQNRVCGHHWNPGNRPFQPGFSLMNRLFLVVY
jgi:hypothetical protein